MNWLKIFLMIFFLLFIFSCKKTISDDIDQIITDKKMLLVSSRIGLKIRQEPSKESTIINILPYGTLVKVKERTENKSFVDGLNDYWYKMDYNNRDVWIFGGYLAEKLVSNPIIGQWKSIQNKNQVWYFYFDNEILAGTRNTDHVFYKGTYELLGNKLYINNFDSGYFDTDEFEIKNINEIIEIEYLNKDKIKLKLDNGIIELVRDCYYEH